MFAPRDGLVILFDKRYRHKGPIIQTSSNPVILL
jgi:hypothetical protein